MTYSHRLNMLLKRVIGLPDNGEFTVVSVINDQLFVSAIKIRRIANTYFYITDYEGLNYRLPKTKFKWMVHRLDDELYLNALVRPMYYRADGDGSVLSSIFNEFQTMTMEIHGVESIAPNMPNDLIANEPVGPLLASIYVEDVPLYQLMMEQGAGEMDDCIYFRDYVQCHRLPQGCERIPRPHRNTEYGRWFNGSMQ